MKKRHLLLVVTSLVLASFSFGVVVGNTYSLHSISQTNQSRIKELEDNYIITKYELRKNNDDLLILATSLATAHRNIIDVEVSQQHVRDVLLSKNTTLAKKVRY